MLYPAPLSKDHKILEQEFCSGYIDSFGKWNTGFYCPQVESTTAVYCCGTPTFKYCCTLRNPDEDGYDESLPLFLRPPVIVAIIAGVTLVLLFITIASCFFCSCCFVYKKRRAHLTGGLYRMQCSSTASGLVYSPSSASNHGSLVTTPLDSDWNPHERLFGVSTTTGGSTPGATANCQNQMLNGNHYLPLGLNGHHHHPGALLSAALRSTNNQARLARLGGNNNSSSISQNNLPPPVFYPQNHLATTVTSGTPSSRTSSISSFAAATTTATRSQNSELSRFPPPTLSSSSNTLYRSQNNQYFTQPRISYANRRALETIGGPGSLLLRPSNNFLTTFGTSGYHHPPHHHQYRRPEILSNGSTNNNGTPFAFLTMPRGRQPGGNISRTPGEGSAVPNTVEEQGSASQVTESQPEAVEARSDEAPPSMAVLNRSGIQRLASCLSSSDSMHQALNASVL